MPSKRQAGMSMIELLVVMAIIAILAAIGIMAYRNSLERAKQKRTMSDIRVIGEAWEARASETQSYQVSGFTFPSSTITYQQLDTAMRPTFARNLPSYDGWKRPMQFGLERVGNEWVYAIRSAGRDGQFDATTYPQGATTDLDCDIVYSNGTFVSWPEVAQAD
jgi:prepilin-type N-terminal cleavage/methylation domain-containing protein